MKGKHPVKNGISSGPAAIETYTFPPVEQYRSSTRRLPSPGWRHEREGQIGPESESGSPAPFDVHRRMSTSAIRLDPLRQPPESTSSPRQHQVQSQGHNQQGHGNRLHPPSRVNHSEPIPPPPSSAHTSHSRGQADHSILHRQHPHGRQPYKTHPSNLSDSSSSPKLNAECA
jgi:hypothetical protein